MRMKKNQHLEEKNRKKYNRNKLFIIKLYNNEN